MSDIVPVSERSITKIPISALHTFRKKISKQTLPQRFRILHNFIEIDSAIRYCILVLIKGGYFKNNLFSLPSSWTKGYLEQNPRSRGQSSYDDDAPIPYWHEIQISPFQKEHHKRSLTLTLQQLGFTIGELQLWLETQYIEMHRIRRELKKKNEELQKDWTDKWMEEKASPDAIRGNEGFTAWCKYAYKKSPAQWWKYVHSKSDHPWTSKWYNWHDYVPYWFLKAKNRHGWQGGYMVQRYIVPIKEKVWFFKASDGFYVPYLFVNPNLKLAQTEYVLTEEAREFTQLSPSVVSQLPEEIKNV